MTLGLNGTLNRVEREIAKVQTVERVSVVSPFDLDTELEKIRDRLVDFVGVPEITEQELERARSIVEHYMSSQRKG